MEQIASSVHGPCKSGTQKCLYDPVSTTSACSSLHLESTNKSPLSSKIPLNSQPLLCTHEPAIIETPVFGVRTLLRSDWYNHKTALSFALARPLSLVLQNMSENHCELGTRRLGFEIGAAHFSSDQFI